MMARQKVARPETIFGDVAIAVHPDDLVSGDEDSQCENKNDSDIVWVNSNWLKGLVPVASRCKNEGKRKEVLIQLYRALDRLKSERDVYVPMYIREVHTCAGNMKELPVNALKSVSPDDKINMFTLDKRI